MTSEFERMLLESLNTGLVDVSRPSDPKLQPDFVLNDKQLGTKVSSYLLQRLDVCDEFYFSASFLRTSGVATLHESLKNFSRRNKGKGRIYVSDYLTFTQPEALERVNQFPNIEVRLLKDKDFHGKGYMFRVGEQYDCLIGSSNLTGPALARNYELNIHLTGSDKSKIIRNFLNIFNQNFNQSHPISSQLLDEYGELYEKRIKNMDFSEGENISSDYIFASSHKDKECGKSNATTKRIYPSALEFTPNKLQIEAMQTLKELRANGADRGLVISATGTGKTVLAAFDVQQFKAKKLLFVVHRLNIAQKAMLSFQQIFGNTRTMGIYSGMRRELDKDFIFSTVQTINSEEHLSKFAQDHFDYIIIDETHRAGANTYKKVLDYFTPKFLLGMTATPERTDGYDIFSLFKHKIASEIRLHRAMDENMLCPFHYFGISDIKVGGKMVDEKTDYNRLVSEERVKHIIDAIKEYGTDNGVPRGLIFCSKVEEAHALSDKFNQHGFKTLTLSGKNDPQEREAAIERLESLDEKEKLDYIFTVDVFNEGIDIPSINQIIMLRPTQSAIVFIQQLGRGLRKCEGKEYVTVIDFIGNYDNNYLIPIALYGDRTFDKDNLRKLLASGSNLIPGSSTVNFDHITKQRIYESINSVNLQRKRELQDDYRLLHFRLGRRPMMCDFLNTDSRDPYQYVNYSGSMYNFAVNEKSTTELPRLSQRETKLLEFLSKHINNAASGLDSFLLRELIKNDTITAARIKSEYKKLVDDEINFRLIDAAVKRLNLRFHQAKQKSGFAPIGEVNGYEVVKYQGDKLRLGSSLQRALNHKIFRNYLLDSTEYSVQKFQQELSGSEMVGGFVRYKKYARPDIHRNLNWDKNPEPALNIGGYKSSEDGSNCPIFVTYKKSDEISESINYDDRFESPERFHWMSKNKTSLKTPGVRKIISQAATGMRIPLFIKKDDNEGNAFYFIGDLEYLEGSAKEQLLTTKGKKVSVVSMLFKVDKPVEEQLYNYLTK